MTSFASWRGPALFLVSALTLTGCVPGEDFPDAGDNGGTSNGGTNTTGGSVTGGTTGGDCVDAARDFYAAENISSNLVVCRTCHMPGGIADATPGMRFKLSASGVGDFDRLRTAWIAMGRNNPTSRILLMASNTVPHSGGALWSTTSQAYKDMRTLLTLMADPDDCSNQ